LDLAELEATRLFGCLDDPENGNFIKLMQAVQSVDLEPTSIPYYGWPECLI
jgi:hypothetical protein